MSDIAVGRGDERGEKNEKLVTVEIDGVEKDIEKGEYTVEQLKEALGVAANRVLAQEINGVLTDLPTDKKVHVKGGEVFASHVDRGGSSSE